MKFPSDMTACPTSPLSATVSLKMTKAGISLQELMDKFDLSHYQLNGEICHEHLMDVARIIDDPESLGLCLGLGLDEVTAIRLERTQQLQQSAMLRRWKQRFAWKATYRTLIKALLECERADLAVKVSGLLTQSERRHGTVYIVFHTIRVQWPFFTFCHISHTASYMLLICSTYQKDLQCLRE